MIALQYDHKLFASIEAWAKHTLLDKGAAFTNYSGYFYPAATNTNYFIYSLPYRPIVSDASIPGANIMSGVYLDRTFITPGQSGLVDINFEKGLVYFTGQITGSTSRLSGNYAVEDFNVKLTNKPEEDLLFETKYSLKPKVGTTISGLSVNDVTFPILYIKNNNSTTDGFAFGGLDKQKNKVRFVILSDNQYTEDGVLSIFRDKTRTLIPLFTGLSEFPFNNYGGYANGVYNYTNLLGNRVNTVNSVWVEKMTTISDLVGIGYVQFKQMNPAIFVSMIDITIESYRSPRS